MNICSNQQLTTLYRTQTKFSLTTSTTWIGHIDADIMLKTICNRQVLEQNDFKLKSYIQVKTST